MEVKQLMNVNESALPKSIRREFSRIYQEFDYGYNDTCTITKPYQFLVKEHIKGNLFENEIDEEINVKLTDEKFTEFWKDYHKGFKKGYNEFDDFLAKLPFNDEDNKIRINRVFNGIFNRVKRLKIFLPKVENDGFLVIKLHLYELGFETGTYVKCWDIILNNHNLFRNIFDLHYTKQETHLKNKNPYPEIFTGNDDKAYNVFNLFAEDVTDPYLDYSFIFQKMINKTEKLIKKGCKHKEFMKWLFDYKYINESDFNDFLNKENFSSKAERGSRPTRYYKIKERYFPLDSD